MRRTIRFVVLSIVAGLVATARADDMNYQNYIIGDRAPGMGGAVAASADSVDAAYYNPAGLAHSRSNQVSVSASLYGVQERRIENAFGPGEDLDARSFVTVPSAVGSVYRLGPSLVGAFSVLVPYDYSAHEMASDGELGHRNLYSAQDRVLWVGPSVGWTAGPDLSLGVSVFGVYRTLSRFISIYWQDEALLYSDDQKIDALSAVVLLGAQYRLAEHWRAGLVLQPPSQPILGSGSFQAQAVAGSGTGDDGNSSFAADLDARYDMPGRMTVGLGWNDARWGCGLDVTHHFALQYVAFKGWDEGGNRVRQESEADAVTDINLGAEYVYLDRYPLRAGFFTSFSAAPEAEVGATHRTGGTDLYGVTASVGRRGPSILTNVGISYVMGSGEALGWEESGGEAQQSVVDAEERQCYLFLNTSHVF